MSVIGYGKIVIAICMQVNHFDHDCNLYKLRYSKDYMHIVALLSTNILEVWTKAIVWNIFRSELDSLTLLALYN